ncbi:MAG: NAD(+)/NADH kinase [Clostridia bacterium]|nr:NAD(+)/NADH kinase [Clostridia bacterium]
MHRIALHTNFNIHEKANCAVSVIEHLQGLGCEIVLSGQTRERVQRLLQNRRGVRFVPSSMLCRGTDLLIVLGGDGSILEAARNAAPEGVPIVGINLGRLGYMAEIEMDELHLLDRIVRDQYQIDERSMLKVEILRGGKEVAATAHALNDAVITNGSVARLVDLELREGGTILSTYRADGLIFATPTGSTAYSMSAGGPIIDPRQRCISVTPICPHSLASRPLIFPDDAVLEAKNICEREKMLYLTMDGRMNFELRRGDVVRIVRADITTKLLRVKERSFYTTLRQKLSSGT